MAVAERGGAGKHNDCLFDAIKTLTNGHLPLRISSPYKFKQFFGVGRSDPIPWNHPKMPELEDVLNDCKLYIQGDANYISKFEGIKRRNTYYVNLRNGHYTPKSHNGR